MKFTVQMKDPDVLTDAIEDALKKWALTIPDLDKEEREAVTQARGEKIHVLCGRWFQHGEYLRVEIDTDAKTCTVLEAK